MKHCPLHGDDLKPNLCHDCARIAPPQPKTLVLDPADRHRVALVRKPRTESFRGGLVVLLHESIKPAPLRDHWGL